MLCSKHAPLFRDGKYGKVSTSSAVSEVNDLRTYIHAKGKSQTWVAVNGPGDARRSRWIWILSSLLL
jgi:hypothetical protein